VRIVYTGGSFDVFHAGHADFLYQCKKIAGPDGKVVVALNSDEFVARFKSQPTCTYEERRRVLEACRYVDEVVENVGNEDSTKTIESLVCRPNFLVIGDDWANRDYYKQMNFTPEWLAERDISLLYVPRHRHLSSTDIKQRILK